MIARREGVILLQDLHWIILEDQDLLLQKERGIYYNSKLLLWNLSCIKVCIIQ